MMKIRSLGMAALIVVLLGGAAFGNPTAFVAETFESVPVGGLPDGWIADFPDMEQYTNANNAAAVVAFEGTKALKLSHQNLNAHPVGDAVFKGIPPQEGRFEVRFNFYPTGNERSLYFGLGSAPHVVSLVQRGVSVAYIHGELRYYDGRWNVIASMPPGKWYDIHFKVDVQTQSFDVHVDGVQAVAGGKFRTATPVIDGMGFVYWRESVNQALPSFYIDNVCVAENCN